MRLPNRSSSFFFFFFFVFVSLCISVLFLIRDAFRRRNDSRRVRACGSSRENIPNARRCRCRRCSLFVVFARCVHFFLYILSIAHISRRVCFSLALSLSRSRKFFSDRCLPSFSVLLFLPDSVPFLSFVLSLSLHYYQHRTRKRE